MIAAGVTLDIAAAIAADPRAYFTMNWEEAGNPACEDAVRTAILLARPV